MKDSNMKRINLESVKLLPNGTKVYVEMTGLDWTTEDKESWNIKQEDGLHYEVEDENNSISFPFDFDYDDNNMSICCYIGEYGCNCCIGDNPVYWEDNQNNAFVDSKGEMMVTVKDKTMRFQVKYCPYCGKEF